MLLLIIVAASQNSPKSGWEAKAVEFFKDHLKEKDAHTWVMPLTDPFSMLIPQRCKRCLFFQCLLMTITFILVQVPSLNDVPLHYLKPNSLVKFRCFIQDMFDPEFYMGAYEAVDPSTKAKVSASLSSPVQLFI